MSEPKPEGGHGWLTLAFVVVPAILAALVVFDVVASWQRDAAAAAGALGY